MRWHGGKWLLAPWIIQFFPAHRIYVESFGGAASVLLRKARCHSEVYNDLDRDAVNLFRVLRNDVQAKKLISMLRLTPFAREEFEASYPSEPPKDPVERARLLVVRSYMGFGSDSHNKERATGFRVNTTRAGISPGGDFAHYPDCLRASIERLRGVMIENEDAVKIMERFDSPDTLHYVDPPYVHSSRSDARGEYAHEMTDKDHMALAECLHKLKGMVVLSAYRCPLYEILYDKWKSFDRLHKTNRKFDRTETIFLNPAAIRAGSQLSML